MSGVFLQPKIFVCFETGLNYVAQDGFEVIAIFLPLPLET